MVEPDANALTGAPAIAPDAVSFIRSEQERGYRNLAIKLGLGADPREAYARLSGKPVPPDSSFPYEDPQRIEILKIIFGSVQRALTAAGEAPFDPAPQFASLPTGDVNARVMPEPKTGIPVIFFEQGLFQYFYDFGQLVGWAAPPIPEDLLGDDEALSTMAHRYTMPFEASDSFVQSLCSYAFEGSPLVKAPRIAPPVHNMPLCIVLLNLMERFVVIHELSHIKLGHVKEAAPEPGHEFEADASSFWWGSYMARQDRLAWAMSYWACELALVAFNILYRAIAVAEFGGQMPAWVDRSHPDPMARRERLRLIWLDPRVPAAGVSAARGLCAMTEALVQRLWEFAAAGLLLARERGAGPSPMWRTLIDSTFVEKR